MVVIDGNQWTGTVHQSLDERVWHKHYRLDRTLEAVRREAETVGRLLGTHTSALLCVRGARVDYGGLDTHGVTIMAASLLRQALGQDRLPSDADVQLLAATPASGCAPAQIPLGLTTQTFRPEPQLTCTSPIQKAGAAARSRFGEWPTQAR